LAAQLQQLREIVSSATSPLSEAIRRTQETQNKRKWYDISVVLPALQRYSVFAASVSGVQLSFSVADRLAKQQGGPGLVLATLQLDMETDTALLLHAARLIWAAALGCSRSVRQQASLPQNRVATPGRQSLAAALRAQRAGVQAFIFLPASGWVARAPPCQWMPGGMTRLCSEVPSGAAASSLPVDLGSLSYMPFREDCLAEAPCLPG
jgi:hypothetical protein